MDRKLSDEQIDKIAKNLLQDFTLDDETLDEIAASPKLWWSVKNQIETEKTRREKSWFFAFRPQILAFGALAIVICFGLTALFLNFKSDSGSITAKQNPVQNPLDEEVKTPESPAVISPKDDFKNPEISKRFESNPAHAKVSVKIAAPKTKLVAKNQLSESSPKLTNNSAKVSPKKAEETKTDFIALSYAANTDSGQIVRVKVPSSMLVSLGVATNVEKESKLVSAEVIIGDDGLARAIRFIR
jgi:hypothetical protein